MPFHQCDYFFHRIEVIRQPTGPDGSRGFTQPRTLRSLSDASSDNSQGSTKDRASHTPGKLENGTPAEEGSVFEDLVAKICD